MGISVSIYMFCIAYSQISVCLLGPLDGDANLQIPIQKCLRINSEHEYVFPFSYFSSKLSYRPVFGKYQELVIQYRFYEIQQEKCFYQDSFRNPTLFGEDSYVTSLIQF